MNFSQISLKFWNEDYKTDFIIGESNECAIEIAKNVDGQIFLCGPRYSGKKHFAYQLAKAQNCSIFLLDNMSDATIIDAYDKQITSGAKAIWISGPIEDIYSPNNITAYDNQIKKEAKAMIENASHSNDKYAKQDLRKVSKDVKSRISSMERAEIFELTADMLGNLLHSRINNIGFFAREEIIKYCINRLPLKYYALQMCVEHIKKMNRISFKAFSEFFDQNYANW